jgi:hypothetical protein
MMISLLLVLLAAGCGDDAGQEASQAAADRILPEPTDRVERYIDNGTFDWRMIRSPGFELYVEPNGYSSARTDSILHAAERAVARATSILGAPEYDRGLRIFMLESREDMQTLTGLSVKGLTPIGDDAVLLVHNAHTRAYLRHEIFHVVSMALWGEPPDWIREGSALYADGTCLDYDDPANTVSAYLYREGMLFPPDGLVYDFDSYNSRSDMIAYLESASLFEYLLTHYGRDTVRSIWTGTPVGEATGVDESTVFTDWLNVLSKLPARDVNWTELTEKGCG